MKTVLRAVVVVVALVSIALAGAASIRAADPTPVPAAPVIGGDLEAFTKRVVITSRSTNPVAVTMTPDGPFTLTPASFNLAPGETVEMSITGEAKGRVSAQMRALTPAAGDTSSVTLQVAFPRPAPWSPPWGVIVGALVSVGAVVLFIRRARPWEWRVTRRPS